MSDGGDASAFSFPTLRQPDVPPAKARRITKVCHVLALATLMHVLTGRPALSTPQLPLTARSTVVHAGASTPADSVPVRVCGAKKTQLVARGRSGRSAGLPLGTGTAAHACHATHSPSYL
jgi:hypothetical protein